MLQGLADLLRARQLAAMGAPLGSWGFPAPAESASPPMAGPRLEPAVMTDAAPAYQQAADLQDQSLAWPVSVGELISPQEYRTLMFHEWMRDQAKDLGWAGPTL